MPTVFLDVVFKPFFKIVHNTGQLLTIDRTNFLADGFHQLIQRTRCVSVNTRFQITPKEKNHTLKDRESEGATAWCFQQWSLTRLQCALWHHLVESGQPRGQECRPPRPLLSLPTEYYPFKSCQVPVGHPVCTVQQTCYQWHSNIFFHTVLSSS